MERVLREFGLGLRSVWRDYETQKLFYECMLFRIQNGYCPAGPCQRSGCNNANPPGTSNHENAVGGQAASLAVDLTIDRWGHPLHGQAASYGLHFPVATEPWHAQPVEVRSGEFTGDPFPWGPPPPPVDPWKEAFVPVLVLG